MSQLVDYLKSKKTGFDDSRNRKDLKVKENGRSADWIIPSFAVGCELACTYCYVARHRPVGNPLHLYGNREAIWQAVKSHHQSLGPKTPNQCDPERWTYDIGESTDCLSPKVVDTTNWLLKKFLDETSAKPTFATKLATGPHMLYRPTVRGQARVRISLMPQWVSTLVEVGTSRVDARIRSINLLVEMGYEVHLNFSPIVAYWGWVNEYRPLLAEVRQNLSPEALKQIKAEVIFLTHHPKSHEANLTWRPEAENLLWTPEWQESKTNLRGDADVLRYKHATTKPNLTRIFRELLAEELPECSIRYIF